MSIAANKSRLNAATQDLWNRWKETRESWRDNKAAEFQQAYLDDLFSAVTSANAALEELEKVVSKIKKDCE